MTQFSDWPATSGIQRVLLELSQNWNDSLIRASWGINYNNSYITISSEHMSCILQSNFELGPLGSKINDRSLWVKGLFLRNSISSIPDSDLPHHFDGFFLPEVTQNDKIMERIKKIIPLMPTASIVYDLIPEIKPFLCSSHSSVYPSRYYRLLTSFTSRSYISKYAKDSFDDLLHFKDSNDLDEVITLGSDSFSKFVKNIHVTQNSEYLIALGTVEKRKGYLQLLEGYVEAKNRGLKDRLVIVGAPGNASGEVLNFINNMKDPKSIEWHKLLNDSELTAKLINSKALLFISENEGFGLPALEALYLKVPLMAHHELPSLSNISTHGQIRLKDLSINEIANSILEISQMKKQEQLRNELSDLKLATWKDFCNKTQHWLLRTLQLNAKNNLNKCFDLR